jgi:predicted nucleic acid-binding protein
VIYLDTSVALAHLFAEDRVPPARLWLEPLVSSRLLEYEMWTRIHARSAAASHGEPARELLRRVALVELLPAVLARATEPFPAPVRTLDALHLASLVFLSEKGQKVELASYDVRMNAAAARMRIPLYGL